MSRDFFRATQHFCEDRHLSRLFNDHIGPRRYRRTGISTNQFADDTAKDDKVDDKAPRLKHYTDRRWILLVVTVIRAVVFLPYQKRRRVINP
jgi:hypothetical protein